MPSPKKHATPTPPPDAPSKTRYLFASNKTHARGPLTREHLAADLEDFQRAGGRIEVLGVTRSLHRINADADASPAPAPPKATPSNPRR